jgi:hypothetical protein
MAQDTAHTIVPVTVVVAFYSRCGSTETRALTAAVGAVNARALIRMRRVPDVSAAKPLGSVGGGAVAGVPANVAADVPACAETLARMHKEYVPPTEADILGTDALVLAVPDGSGVSSPEWAPLVAMLAKLYAEGKLRGKVAAVVQGGSAAANASFASLLHEHGFAMVPPRDVGTLAASADALAHVRAHGRLVATISRATKSASP